jgi:hypothetical protein
MPLLTREKKPPPPDLARLRGTAEHVFRCTAGMTKDGGLRLRWELLDQDERGTLADLVERISHQGGWDTGVLSSREVARLEGLIEKGASAPDVFTSAREAALLRAEIAQAQQEASRVELSQVAEKGLIAMFGQQLQEGCISSDHLSVLIALLCIFVSGRPAAPESRFVGAAGRGGVLVCGRKFGPLGSYAAHMSTASMRWPKIIEHLRKNDWLLVETHGAEYRIALGPRVQWALDRRPPGEDAAA